MCLPKWMAVFALGISLALAQAARAQTGIFATTGGMTEAVALPPAVLLNSGEVLVVFGDGTANLYNPGTGTFSPTGGNIANPNFITATLLLNGQVLLTRGNDPAGLYNPSTGTFSWTGTLTGTLTGYTATLLNSGKVLFIGGGRCGRGSCGMTASAELYDPVTGTFTATGNLNIGRAYQTATLLSNGEVLVAGGYVSGAEYQITATTEIYNPATGTFSLGSNMTKPRTGHIATLLPGGSVLVAGPDTSAEVYNPSTGSFSPTGSSATPLQVFYGAPQCSSVLLDDGRVLFITAVVNLQTGNTTSAAEEYDPVAGTFSPTGAMHTARWGASATLLPDGRSLWLAEKRRVTLSDRTSRALSSIRRAALRLAM
jgi:hypothetical protein